VAQECLGYPPAGVPLLFNAAALEATQEFLWRAHEFDPRLDRGGLLQALRNFWVFHSIQLALGQEVGFSSAAFAYSMLYPWTDNYLDDPRIGPVTKSDFGVWLGARLLGTEERQPDAHASQVSRLIGMIEQSFPRDRFVEGYQSLFAIHAAQMNSLKQHCAQEAQNADAVLRITVEKGGASVLADGYLVLGRLSESEADFAFGYGVVLQMMDDMQDVRRDQAARHTTMFTLQAALGPLDGITTRLWGLISEVLGQLPDSGKRKAGGLGCLLRENCRQLIVQSVALNPDFFSNAFVERLERCSPFRFCFLKKRQKSVRERCRRLVELLERR